MASKPAKLPGVADIRAINTMLALGFWLCVAGWLALLHGLTPLVVRQAGAAPFWTTLGRSGAAFPVAALAVLIGVAGGLRFYLKHMSVRAGWLLPLLFMVVNLGATGALLFVLVPILKP